MMPTKNQDVRPKDLERRNNEQRDALIVQRVMSTLGKPSDLYSVQVRQLWGDHYRVNVLIGANASSVRVAHSFFVEADGDGNVVASTPELTKQY